MNRQQELTMGTPLSPLGKVYSYSRFSSDKQAKGHSLERQSDYAERWAAEHGMVLDESLRFSDEGYSAYHGAHVKNGKLGEFLRSIEQGIVPPGSVLIVEGLDRLSRDKAHKAQTQLSTIIEAGVAVVTAQDGKIYSRESIAENPMDLIYSLMIMIRAHEESETKAKRVTASIQKKALRWVSGESREKINSGTEASWVKWDKENKRFELVPETAEVIRRAVSLWLDGYSVNRIRKILAAEGRDGPFSTKSLSLARLLRARPYLLIGTRVVRTKGQEYWLKNYYPPLIDEETYHRVVASFQNKPKTGGRESLRPCIFTGGSGIFRCGYCGCAMGADSVKFGRNRRRARCTNRECLTASVSLLPMETAFISFCSDQLNLDSLVGKDRGAEIKSRLAQSRTMLAGLEKQLSRLVDAMLATDKPAAAFAAKASEIEDQISALKDAIRVDESMAASLATAAPTFEAAKRWKELAAQALGDGSDNGDYDARIKMRRLVLETFSTVTFYRFGLSSSGHEKGKHTKFSELVLVSRSGVTRHLRYSNKGELVAMVDESRLAVA